jgi:predicted membrane-bound spermidine synthase
MAANNQSELSFPMSGVSTGVDDPSQGQVVWPYYLLFFASGFPALLYQIVWERALFTLYGVNIQSVTLIVTVFMLGLGIGSIAGGRLSQNPRIAPARVFGVIELSIGAFGFLSLGIFHRVASFTAGATLPVTGLIAFLLLLIPTTLMGSTLPLLVEHFVQQTGRVGESVASLYSVNTLGSAVACYSAVKFVMRLLGEQGSIRLAVCINLLVGVTVLLLNTRRTNGPSISAPASSKETTRFGLAVVLAAAVGFVSLGYEIVWYRIYSFSTAGAAPSFAMLLAAYLAGIGYGSFAVRDFCRKKLGDDIRATHRAAASIVVVGSVVGFLFGPALAFSIRFIFRVIPGEVSLVLVFIAAALLGAVFPLLAHAAIRPNEQTGSRISYLYLSNIIGCTLGSFLVGFIFMDQWSIKTISLLLLGGGVVISVALMATARPFCFSPAFVFGCVAALALALGAPRLFSKFYERLLYKDDVASRQFTDVVENRSGVITVASDDRVFGGGVYDGHFNTDLVNDVNRIYRAYLIANLHPKPERVLMIGLASGSWAQVIVNNQGVKHFTAVEINPGYLPLISQRSAVSNLLKNPKVKLVIDDGRRWLVAHPEERFDLIVMNTTYSWRANATNLLSKEFLQLMRSHMLPGGIAFYNTTSSGDAQLTGATEFNYALRVHAFLAVSDSPIVINKDRLRAALLGYKIDGRPVLDASQEKDRSRLDWILQLLGGPRFQPAEQGDETETRAELLDRWKHGRLITDDNMGDEWGYDAGL